MVQLTINDDLRKERTMCTFNLEELTNLLDDGVEKTKQRREIGTYMIIYMYIIHTGYNRQCRNYHFEVPITIMPN